MPPPSKNVRVDAPSPAAVRRRGPNQGPPLPPPGSGPSSPRGSSEGPVVTNPDPLQGAPQLDTRGGMPTGASPMQVDLTTVEAPNGSKSQPGGPRSQPRAPASAQPSGMLLCPMPRCARREGACPTGWGCLQSLISHLRSVHLSAASAPPEVCLRALNLRVCLACNELSAVWARFPGPRCFSAVLAAFAAGNSAKLAQTRSTLSGPPPTLGSLHPSAACHTDFEGFAWYPLRLSPAPSGPLPACCGR